MKRNHRFLLVMSLFGLTLSGCFSVTKNDPSSSSSSPSESSLPSSEQPSTQIESEDLESSESLPSETSKTSKTSEQSEEPPVESSEEPPVESSEEPPAESSEEPPVETSEQSPVDSSEEPPVESSEQPPVESSEEPPIESSEQPPVESSEEPPIESSEEPPIESSEEPPVESSSSEEPPIESSEEPVPSNFTITTDLSTPFEIHTAEQKTFLSYEGDYETMPDNLYPDGKNHLSDSNPVTLSWNYSVPAGKSVSSFEVTFGQESDLNDGYTVNVGSNKTASLSNPYLGTNYFKIKANLNGGGSDETEIKTFTVDSSCPRNLTIGGMTNCRDIGGRLTEDGGRIKQGLVYRTSGYKYDYSTVITDAGKKEMLEHLKVKTEVNVADGTSYNLKLTGTNVVDLKMDYDSSGANSTHHFSRNAENVKNFFKLLSDSSNYPVFFHCRIGTDRTGLCAILLAGLLGVPLNEIYQDYLFSNFGKIQEKRYIGAKAGQDNIQKYINDIKNFSGATFKNKVYNILLSIGVPSETLDTVINNLTEGNKVTGNDAGQIVALGDKLTGNGVSVTTDTSTRDHPDKYFVLDSSSKSVSYSFNAKTAFKGQIVAYLGNTEHSSSKKIGDAITCSLDSNGLAIRDVTYADAGMGNCSGRMNYFPVILGSTDIAAGNHTIKIGGTSNKMNIAAICIYDASTAPDIGGGGSQGGGEQGGDHTHDYKPESPQTNKAGKSVTTYLCDCGAKYMAIAFNDYSSANLGTSPDMSIGKLGKNSVFKWDFPAKAGRVTLQFNLKCSNSNHVSDSNKFDPSKYIIKVNGTAQALSLANQGYKSMGLTTSGQYYGFCTFDIDADKNVEIELDHNNTEYRLLFTEEVRLIYA